MRLLVYMKDGRTVYRIVGRAKLAILLNRELTDEDRSLPVDRGIWNPTTGEYVWRGIRIRFINKGSIAVIEEDEYTSEVVAA